MKGRLAALLLLHAAITTAANPDTVAAIDRAVTTAEWKTAIKLSEDWVETSPEEALAHYWLAVSLRTKMQKVNRIRAMGSVGDYKRSLARAIELDPNLVDARAERIGYLIHAPGIAGGDREEAAEEIEALEGIDPKTAAEMAVELAQAENDRGAMLAAIARLQALEPELSAHRLQEALVLISDARYDEAEAQLTSVADSDEPGVALGAMYQRARWRVIAGQDAEVAISLLETYIAERGDDEVPWAPDRAAAYWRLGLAQELSGDLDAALASVERSVALNAVFDPAKKDLRRLQRAR